jgi:CRISPR-associated protein Cas2
VYLERLNAYRIMWVMIFFDLPTEDAQDRKNYTRFRDKILEDGFTMFQFSIYIRHCASRENADVHIKRIKDNLPPDGHIGILCITDKQFGMMELFYGVKKQEPEGAGLQLEMF